MGFHRGPNIVRDELILALDAGSARSYPGSGTTWKDLSGNGYDASFVGSVGYSTTYNGVLSVDGNQTTNYISFDENALGAITTSQIWSLETILRLDSTSGTTYFHSMSTTAENNFYITQKAGNQIFPYNETLSSGTIMTFSAGETFVLTIVHESGVQKYYKNGQFASAHSPANNIEGTESWILNQEQDSVGGGFDPSQATDMGVYGVRLYDKSLSPEEVLQNYNATKSRFNL